MSKHSRFHGMKGKKKFVQTMAFINSHYGPALNARIPRVKAANRPEGERAGEPDEGSQEPLKTAENR